MSQGRCSHITLDILLTEPVDGNLATIAAQNLATQLGPLIVGGVLHPSKVIIQSMTGVAHIE